MNRRGFLRAIAAAPFVPVAASATTVAPGSWDENLVPATFDWSSDPRWVEYDAVGERRWATVQELMDAINRAAADLPPDRIEYLDPSGFAPPRGPDR